jgi:beta-lactamase regulating signal transducer with metallopeptidase domain
MISMKAEIHTLCAHVISATLNGAYQGILVALLVPGLLRLMGRSNAATRHAAWFASLLLVALIIPAHCWLDGSASEREESRASAPLAAGVCKAEQLSLDSNQPFDLGLVPSTELSNAEPAGGPVAPGLAADEMPGTAMPPLGPGWGIEQEALLSTPWVRFASLTQAVVERFLSPVSLSVDSVLGSGLVIVLLYGWLAVVAVRFTLLLFRLRQVGRFTKGSWSPQQQLHTLFEELKLAVGTTRRVELRVSYRERCPVVLGFFRPVILLPADIAGEAELNQARQVLRHELAHVRRYDDWANLVQHFVQAVFFFHPAVWWIGKHLSLEREIACDDYVLQQGGGRRNYALILASVASRIHKPTPMLAPGVSNSNSQLQQRISMILDTRRNSSPSLAGTPLVTILTATGFVASLALFSGPRLVLAATSAPAPAALPAAGFSEASAVTASPAAVTTPAAEVFAAAETPVVAVGIDPGPKFKPDAPTPPATPDFSAETPDPPNEEMAPRPPRAPRAGKPGRAPRAAESPDGSIEERVQRLEKMVRSLMEQQGVKRSHGMMYLKDGNNQGGNLDQEKMEKLKHLAERQGDIVAQEKLREMAERQAARATEQAQRAAEQAKRATKELEARMEHDEQNKGDIREGFQRQLEALRKAREGLGQEMDRLNRQIEKLERAQQRSEKEPQRRSEANGEHLQAQVDAPDAGEQ